ncbi:S8 family serine peptidase [Flammeovirga kamogawensis]|uniref:S8 family serine peptidase n=1 Tax=Flammeovirga kamogawensis TaxID=373891 RepID=A0ABX8GSP2_9BACT|nr:S8 family serine peptidase [Flammeovirga kamogawensis]MBB6461362.1 subtilisin family serine protease [Flammeovirga kamogawensis]QWG06267.1 S8 family serine peptidase [Flammeovirga kamogawensis]TRX68097.1 S8 family serine peptidase [Flammeovirga kamogawensis]
MKIHLLRVLAFLMCLFFGVLNASESYAQTPISFSKGVAQGVIRVKFKEATDSRLQITPMNGGVATLGIASFDATAHQYGAENMKRVFPYNAKFEHKLRKHGLHLWYQMDVQSNVSLDAVVQSFSNLPDIELAETIKEKQLIEPDAKFEPISKEQIQTLTDTAPVNDPLLSKQWHYHNDGSGTWTKGADVNLFTAWETTMGSNNVIVSIHDEGIDVNHEDLKNNIWINEAELNGVEGEDSDGNGYIDDIYGWNFSSASGSIAAQSHGTHVGGTVSAVNNNGIGVAGVAGGDGENQGALLMSCQILGGPLVDVAPSYIYAANNGAVISQNSWGYTTAGYYDQVVLDAIDYFIAEAGDYEGAPMKGGIVIFASGNSNNDGEWYPGYYEPCFTVASTNPNDQKANYSNYGDWIELSAPGGETASALTNGVLSTLPGNDYGFYQGTSMACPHVSGIAALVLSHLGGETMTPNQLKSQLLTGVVSIESQNPSYEGKLGSGRIDASFALKENEGLLPDEVNSLEVAYAGVDHIALKWQTPADEDDGQASTFEIYYKEGTFDLDSATKVVVNSASGIGEWNEYRINELAAETEYSFAILAIDRWGNTSSLSTSIIGATNLGPKLILSKSSLSIAADIVTSPTANDEIIFQNEEEGKLSYSLETRYKNHYPKNYTILSAGSIAKTSNMGRENSPKIDVMSLNDHSELEDFEDQYFEYCNKWFSPTFFIGDNDLTKSNTAAVAFIAPEGGFNLTDFEIFLNDLTEGKTKVQVYQGNILSSAILKWEQELEPQLRDIHYFTLEEQLYFPEGEVFWLVTRIPSGNKYPLVIGDYNFTKEGEDKMFYSNDDGKSWSYLIDAVGDKTQSFLFSAISKNPSVGEFITLAPASGDVLGHSEQTIVATVNASTLVNGTYTSVLFIESNDPEEPLKKLNISTKVEGHPSAIKTFDIVDFGSVQVGHEKELIIEVANYGYGIFKLANNVTTEGSTSFELTEKPYTFYARKVNQITLKYTPTQAGVETAKFTFTDDTYGGSFEINLTAVGIEPSKIEVTPSEQAYTLPLGETDTGVFTINNLGNYPLQYSIPLYDEDREEGVHRFGYSWDLVSDNFVWEELEDQEDVLDFTQQFKDNSFLDFIDIELGFDFPFFDTLVNEMHVSHVGMIALDTKDPVNGSWGKLLGSDFTSNGYVAGLYLYTNIGLDTKFLYKRFSDHVVMEYKNLYTQASEDNFNESHKITYQIVLYADGNIEYRYQDVWGIRNSNAPFIGVESPDKQDGFYIYENSQQPEKLFTSKNSNVTIKVNHPGRKIARNLSSVKGIVPVGQSVDITYDVVTEGLDEMRNTQNLSIFTNDPITPLAHFTLHADVISGGEAIITKTRDDLPFGDVYKTASPSIVVMFRNQGNKPITFTSAVVENGLFEVDKNTFTIDPRLSETLKVSFTATVDGLLEDNLIVTDELGTVYTFPITANVIHAPMINVDNSEHFFTLNAGESDMLSLIVDNSMGEADLEVLPMGSHWLYEEKEMQPASVIPNYSYAWKDNMKELSGFEDLESPSYQFIDITKNGEKIDLELDDYWKAVKLPFSFNYYGIEYDSIYIGIHGQMSFNYYHGAPLGDKIWYPLEIPFAHDINNLVAPLWMAGETDYYDENPNKGIWYYEDDEKFVVTYERYQHFASIMGGHTTAETIFYKDGRIKMQYKTWNQTGVDFWSKWLTIGLENQDGTEGVMVNFYRSYIQDGLVIEYTPTEKTIIPAGESKTLHFAVDAENLLDGQYKTTLALHSESPNNEKVEVPVNLTVNGTATLQWDKEVIDLGDLLWSQGQSLEVILNTQNIGTKGLDLMEMKSIRGTNPVIEIWGYNLDWNGNPFGDPLWKNTAFFDPMWAPWPGISPLEDLPTRITISPMDSGVFLDSIVVNDNMGLTDTLVIKANLILPPNMEIATDTIHQISLDNQSIIMDEIVVSNVDGASDLAYTVEVEYPRQGLVTSASVFNSESIVTPLSATRMHSVASGIGTLNTEFDDEINYYKGYEKAGGIGYGANSFSTLTKFKAPKTGFNLSHVSTWYVPAGLANADLMITIGVGDIDNPTVLHQESFTTETAFDDLEGELQSFELSNTVQFYPGETIYMIITYPFGPARPQGFVESAETMSDISYIEVNGAWLDVTSDNRFPLLLWMNALHQSEGITPWVTLSSFEGTVAAGSSEKIDVTFTPSNTFTSYEEAMFNFTSNDKSAEIETVVTTLTSNTAPEFIEIPTIVEMDEASERMIKVVALDKEGHTISFTIDENVLVNSTSIEDDTLLITLSTDYDSEGEHELRIAITDEHGVSSSAEIQVIVHNVNRAPEMIAQDTLFLHLGDTPSFLNPSEIFIDADGDKLTYGIAASDDGKVMASMSQGQFAILGLVEGVTEVALIATDVHGASGMTMLVVDVSEKEIEEEEELPTVVDKNVLEKINLRNYPNPVHNKTTFTFTLPQQGDVVIQIFNLNGVVEKTISMGTLSNGNHELNVAFPALSNGIHIYTISINGTVKTYNKLIKK